MPTFATPEPVSVTVELLAGDLRLSASERTDTVVEVRPSDPDNPGDVRAAAQTKVEAGPGTVLVRGPGARGLELFGRKRSVDISIELPAGSAVHVEAAAVNLHGTGRLAECHASAGLGHVRLDETGPLRVKTGAGNVVVHRVGGDAEVSTGSGRVTVDEIAGSATLKNSNGATELGHVAGPVRVRAANGDISVRRGTDDVDAKTASGSIRLAEAAGGSVTLRTALGDIEVGIAADTAAWLDVRSDYGRVHSDLDEATAPDAEQGTVAVHAQTSCGNVLVHRS